MPVIIDKISKSYEKTRALKEISLEVNDGEIFGLIGPDGAGKSSLLRIIATLLLPDSGSVNVLGLDAVKDYKKVRRIIGYMPGRFSLYQDLSVEENLELFAAIFGTTIKENYDLIKDIYSQIEPFKTRLAGQLSGGMKQKLALSCAMIHKPDLLILDEPTTGVDPVSRKEFWGMLRRLKEVGITIIVSTPYMDEANLCDRIGLIHNGNLLSINKPDAMIAEFPGKLFSVRTNTRYEMIQFLSNNENTHSAFMFGEEIHYADKREQVGCTQLGSEWNQQCNLSFTVTDVSPSIEDCFMSLMLTQNSPS
jgi:ABC-type multidrug transport system ATPase subunit